MRAHPAILRSLLVQGRQQGKTYRELAREFRLPEGTLRSWKKRHATEHATASIEGDGQRHATEHATQGEWMQSLLHETAHFLVSGVPACSSGPNGAKVTPGMQWFKHDGCLRKCLRCMRHENDSTEARA